MTMTITPISNIMGAEVGGIDVTHPLDEKTSQDLRDAVFEHQVIVVRGQHPTPQQYVDFAKAFGELEPFFLSNYNLAEQPEIYVLSNKRVDGKPVGRDGAGTHWHSESTFLDKPSAITLLHAVEVPEEGGDTLFIDTYSAYEDLPDHIKQRIDGKRAIHRYQKKEFVFSGDHSPDADERTQIADLQLLREVEAYAGPASPTARAGEVMPAQLHPIVRTNPVTGRKALFLNEEMTVGIDGVDQEEGSELLHEVCRLATTPDRILRFQWRPGDIVIWDNASTSHTATYTDPRYPRLMYRLTIEGDRPY